MKKKEGRGKKSYKAKPISLHANQQQWNLS